MVSRPAVLCPIDFSDASRGALRYGAAIAEHFYADLTVLAVTDQFLANAANARYGGRWIEQRTEAELEHFVRDTFPGRTPQMPELKRVVVTGSAASAVLGAASEMHADLIVMSTHGASGIRKMMFGSTTERVLRQTTTPVIVTPSHDPGPESLEDWRRSVAALLVPVDLSPYSEHQVRIASSLAAALGTSITLLHALEPMPTSSVTDELATQVTTLRADLATRRLDELVRTIPSHLNSVTALVSGDPAEQIARFAREHSIDAVVMGLHSSVKAGPRMGTVTYRLLCETPVLVVAWPPARLEHRLRFLGDEQIAAEAQGAAV